MPPRGLEKKFTLTYQRYLILDAYEQWAGFAYGKDWPFTKENTGIGCDYQPSEEFTRITFVACQVWCVAPFSFTHSFIPSFSYD